MRKQLTTKEFIERAKNVHGDRYNYSKVEYINNHTHVVIICPIHGEFEQRPSDHLQGKGCKECGYDSIRLSTEKFIAKAREIHGLKYDYSKVKYTGNKFDICIICPIHGEFNQSAKGHLSGYGCPKCGIKKRMVKKLFNGIVDYRDIDSSLDRLAFKYWNDMINRRQNSTMLKKFPTYMECSVCEEWLIFSNFMEWFRENHIEGCELDKDILVKGNKVYGPDTCCFVPHQINTLIIRPNRIHKEYPIGVSFDFSRGKYAAHGRINGKQTSLGRFNTPEEAFLAYKTAKESYIKEVAQKYYDDGKITKRVYDALMRYEVEITD